jgi:molybdenum cofactor cytidylyltransferase
MWFGALPVEQAEGKVLAHNVAGMDGRRLFRKGRTLTAEDVAALKAAGRANVYVAQLGPADIDEDSAARQLAKAVAGAGLRLSGPASGRVNLLATGPGVLRVAVDRLAGINACEGLTLATLPNHSPVRARQITATVKVIPFAVPDAELAGALQAAGAGDTLRVDPLPAGLVTLILSGSPAIREKLLDDCTPLIERINALGSAVTQVEFIPLDSEQDETRLTQVLGQISGQHLIVLAGETAIMDRHDIVPRALERAGGVVEAVGAPVDPGNLLMLGYLGPIPVLGAPGCARSRKLNIIDWVLPRLLAGDRLTRRDIILLGHGGLLEDAPERPLPRSKIG